MIGNILLTLALMASVFTVFMYYRTYKGDINTLKLARIGYHSMTVMVIAASAFLLYAILTHQYQYGYVYNYSGSGLPTGLLMSTFYAGQEGSFMLWLFFTAITGLILLEYSSKRGDLEQRVMMTFTLAVAFLLIMVNPLLKSPFNYIWTDPSFIDSRNINSAFLGMPFIQNFLFTDSNSNTHFIKMSRDLYGVLKANGISINEFIIQGKGLNPLLQNFWMQIHPPMLFVGFAMSTVPFSFAVAALLKNEYKEWVKQAMPWVLSGAMVLGLAIMLGGYWAYGVLGWGGYWGWDPVENSSLVPWIIGVASIHTLLVQKKTQADGGIGRFGKTNLVLCILTFLLVLYSTFLTRSGILGDASVHSFVDPGMTVYLLLVLFVGAFAFIGFGGIAYRWKYLNEYFNAEDNILSRELALFTGSIALIASAIIILVGTSAPLFGQSVELRFYNELNLPIAIIIGVLNGFSLVLKWNLNKGNEIFRQSLFSIVSTIIVSLLIIILGGITDLMLILLVIATTFALVVNLEIAFKIINGRKTYLGAYIAHTGIAIFLLGVVATGGFSKEQQITLTKGERVEAYGYGLTFTGYSPIDNGKKYAFHIEIEDGQDKLLASPVMYIAEFNNSLMREPDIVNRITKDFYISPIGYDSENSNNGQDEHSHVSLNKGDSYEINGAKITFNGFNFPSESMAAMQAGQDFFIGANLEIKFNGKTESLEPRMQSINGERGFVPVEYKPANLRINMENLDASGIIDLVFSNLNEDINESQQVSKEVLTIEASIKPFINLVWAGVLIMVIGFFISVVRRSKESVK